MKITPITCMAAIIVLKIFTITMTVKTEEPSHKRTTMILDDVLVAFVCLLGLITKLL